MTRHEWFDSTLVSQLAESFALERFTAFHFSVVHDLTAEGSASSLNMLDGGKWNNPPVASQDFYGAVHGQSISVSAPGVLENDYDTDYAPPPGGTGKRTIVCRRLLARRQRLGHLRAPGELGGFGFLQLLPASRLARAHSLP